MGRKSAGYAGYGTELLDSLRAFIWESFTVADNPQPHICPRPGETVPDLGCGTAIDLFQPAVAVLQGAVRKLNLFPTTAGQPQEASFRASAIPSGGEKTGSDG